MLKLDLLNITLVFVDCFDIERLKKPIEYSTRGINFADVFVFSSKYYGFDNAKVYSINNITNHLEYSKFMIKDLNKYIKTDYCLVSQHDGYLLNPNAWTNEFLNYDYIGAKWAWAPDNTSIVGNGGFSLRSKKLLEILQDKEIEVSTPEDSCICQKYYKYLTNKGIKFAPVEIADKFSIERGVWVKEQFGFHNKKITLLGNWDESFLEYKNAV